MKTNDEYKNDTESASQNAKILKHLMRGQKLTQLEALSRFGCFRLGARIHDLKAKDYPIESERYKMNNGKIVARYFITKANRQLI